VIDNPEKNAKIENLQKEFYLNINSLKTLISEYDKTNDTQYVLDAVELYKERILPNVKECMETKYVYSAVEYNEDDNTYHLIQKHYDIGDLEFNMGVNDYQIINFQVGMNNFKQNKKQVEEEEIIEYGE
jgi:hypothetical protein